MAGVRRPGLLLAAFVVGTATPAARADWAGSLAVTTDNVYRGLSQSNGKVSGQLEVNYHAAAGWYAGISAASVERGAAEGTHAQLAPYVGYEWRLAGEWHATVSAAHYEYAGYTPRRYYDYDELTATAAFGDRLFLTVAATPDFGAVSPRGYVSGRPAFSYEADLHLPVPRTNTLSVNTGIGYDDLHHALGVGFVYWDAGLGYAFRAYELDVSYIGTSASARALIADEPATHRGVATLVWHF